MDVKDILKLATNPLITGALGAYVAKEKLGPKYGTVLTMAGGALAGAIAGALVQKFLAPPTPAAPAAAPPVQGLPAHLVNLDFGQPQLPPPVHQLPAPRPAPHVVPEGVFSKTSYDTDDGLAADAVIDEIKQGGWGN